MNALFANDSSTDTYKLQNIMMQVISQISYPGVLTSRKHLRTKETPDFHLTYSKYSRGKSGVGIKMIKSEKIQYFSIKSYVVDVY